MMKTSMIIIICLKTVCGWSLTIVSVCFDNLSTDVGPISDYYGDRKGKHFELKSHTLNVCVS